MLARRPAGTEHTTINGAMRHPAVFLDRDNTLIANDGDLGDPAQVEIMPGVAAAIGRLRDAGYRIVVVSNQGGVARGAFSEADVEAVNRRTARLVDEAAGRAGLIDRFYYCPYHPEGTVERYRAEHPWRKPAPGMLRAAAGDLDLDLARSWLVGDQPRDIAAGRAAGCRTVILSGDPETIRAAEPTAAAADLESAAGIILARAAAPGVAPVPAGTARLAILCPSWVGDTIMATPVLRAARLALPSARIVAGCRPGLEALLAGLPWIDAVAVAETKRLSGTLDVAARLRGERPEAVILLPNSFRAGLIGLLSRAPRRIGYRRSGRGRLLTHALDPPPRRPPEPAINYYARLGAFALGLEAIDRRPQLAVTDAERAEAGRLLQGVARPFALLCPGASKPQKRWPAERFARLAEALARRGIAAASAGSLAEAGIVAQVAAGARAPVADLVRLGLSLGALKGVVAEAAIVVTNDTGPRHIAAALGRPAVTLFGPTDPRWTTLEGAPERIVTAEPFLAEDETADDDPDRCDISRIAVGDVLAAIGSLVPDPRP
jgi:lipopolysaccharide heptosyltransferase II